MIGDTEKLLTKGDVVTMWVMGEQFTVTVKDVSVELYERQYLVQFSDNPADVRWVNNTTVRSFRFQN